MRTLGVIPARGGSKRLPGKNIAACFGKPLVAWSIESAKGSELSEAIVSTDDPIIGIASELAGGYVPFLRPQELATDEATTKAVLIHAFEWAVANLWKPDYVVLLQPTSPTRTSADINLLLRVLEHQRPDTLTTTDSNGDPDGLLYAYTPGGLLGVSLAAGHHIRWRTGRQVPDINTAADLAEAERQLRARVTSKIPREGIGLDY